VFVAVVVHAHFQVPKKIAVEITEVLGDGQLSQISLVKQSESVFLPMELR
jgi:hypothetical protein